MAGKTDDADTVEYNDMVIPKYIGQGPGNGNNDSEDDDYEDLNLGGANQDDDDLDNFEDDDDPRYIALQEQMGVLQDMMQQNNQFYQSAFAQLAAGGRGSDQAAAGEDTGAFNLDDLPDPVEDRAGFNKALQGKVTDFVKAQAKQTQDATQSANQMANLENDLVTRFYRDYPDLAEKTALFRAAVTEEVGVLKTGGINAAQSIQANPAAFLKKVAGRMADELGIDPEGDDNTDDGGNNRRTPRKRQAGGRNGAARTRNLGTSSRPKRRGGPGKGKQPPKPKGFLAELRQQQADFGLI